MKYFYYSILALLIFSSCEKEIHIDLKSVEPQLVIEGLIPMNSFARVHLSMSKDFFDYTPYPLVEDAIVTISDDAGNEEILHLSPSGWYVSGNIVGVIGRTYYLNVETGGKTYTSVSTMPEIVPIDSISMFYVPAFQEALPMVNFTDPEGIENYFRFILSINNKVMPGIDIDSDEDRDGKKVSHLLSFNPEDNGDEGVEKGDTISVETRYIDEGAFRFYLTLGMIGMSQANPDNNIEGGALGYFSAYSFCKTSIIANW